jgi:hypothetical protein
LTNVEAHIGDCLKAKCKHEAFTPGFERVILNYCALCRAQEAKRLDGKDKPIPSV